MEDLITIRRAAEALGDEALAGRCEAYGMVVAGVGAWGGREDRRVALEGDVRARLVHDEREAPYDASDADLLVSLTDEGDVAVCAWARPYPQTRADLAKGGRLRGIGIDLASTEDFAGKRGERFNRLLFSETEQAFVQEHYAEKPAVGFAYAFSAKEAAFKSLAAPLRAWYEDHDEEFLFEVREFELADATHERGTLRHACAQAAMDAMGITSIELFHRELDDAVLTLALAHHA